MVALIKMPIVILLDISDWMANSRNFKDEKTYRQLRVSFLYSSMPGMDQIVHARQRSGIVCSKLHLATLDRLHINQTGLGSLTYTLKHLCEQ